MSRILIFGRFLHCESVASDNIFSMEKTLVTNFPAKNIESDKKKIFLINYLQEPPPPPSFQQ